MELRRSSRINADMKEAINYLSTRIHEDINKYQLLTDVDARINSLIQIYKKLSFEFDTFYTCSSFLHTAYQFTFKIFKDALTLRNRENLGKMQMAFTKYRKRYEKRRTILWGISKWTKYLPLDIINMIETFL